MSKSTFDFQAFETSDKRTRVVITATNPEWNIPSQEICNIIIDDCEAEELMSALKLLFKSGHEWDYAERR